MTSLPAVMTFGVSGQRTAHDHQAQTGFGSDPGFEDALADPGGPTVPREAPATRMPAEGQIEKENSNAASVVSAPPMRTRTHSSVVPEQITRHASDGTPAFLKRQVGGLDGEHPARAATVRPHCTAAAIECHGERKASEHSDIEDPGPPRSEAVRDAILLLVGRMSPGADADAGHAVSVAAHEPISHVRRAAGVLQRTRYDVADNSTTLEPCGVGIAVQRVEAHLGLRAKVHASVASDVQNCQLQTPEQMESRNRVPRSGLSIGSSSDTPFVSDAAAAATPPLGAQLLDGIMRAFEVPPKTPPATVSQPAAPLAGPQSPVRTLELQLSPESLGLVTVVVSVRDDTISIRLAADRDATIALVEQERDHLSSRLAAAGYVVEDLAVTRLDKGAGVASASGFAVAGDGNQASGKDDPDPQTAGGSGGSRDGRDSGAAGDRQHQPDRRIERADSASTPPPDRMTGVGAVARVQGARSFRLL